MKDQPVMNIRMPTNSGYEVQYIYDSKNGKVYRIGPLKIGAEYTDEPVHEMTRFEIFAVFSHGPAKLKSWLGEMGLDYDMLLAKLKEEELKKGKSAN